MYESVVVPCKIEDEFCHRKRERYLPYIHVEKADDDDDHETSA
jgi:hypothetical protein